MVDVDIAIIGGGIAGLSAALACHTLGHKAHVFEAAPEFKAMGTSLSLWPNAMGCLADWGLDKQITQRGSVVDQLAWRRLDGRAYFEHPLNGLYDDIGHKGVCIRRSDLHEVLVASLPSEYLHRGCALTQFKEEDGAVALTFANGDTVRAKHVVAADGIRSQIRTELLEDGPPKYAGYGAWLGLSGAASLNAHLGEACEYIGRNGRLGVIETGNDTRYWFFVSNEKTSCDHAVTTDARDVMALLVDWPQRFRDFVADSQSDDILKVSFFERAVSRIWGKGRVTVIGDALHPFVPNLGQGACQSIEDAHTLARGIAAGKMGPELTAYMEQARFKRVDYMQKTASRVGQLAQGDRGFMSVLRRVSGMGPFHRAGYNDIRKQFTYS